MDVHPLLLVVVTGVCTVLLALFLPMSMNPSPPAPALVSVSFVVTGRVQGVFFRKYTYQQAIALDLVGHVRNDRDGTVVGTVQGARPNVDRMKAWLETTGSPSSVISKVEYGDLRELLELEYDTFQIRATSG